jgi:hypothetical protein
VTDPTPPRLVRVTLTADERTVEGGTASTSWRYFDGTRWLSLRDHPQATMTRLDCGPGMTWQTQAEVSLPVGSWLLRVDRFPNHRHQPSDPMEYLRRQVRTRRYAVRHSFFRITRDGSLRRRPREEAPVEQPDEPNEF